MIKYIKYLTFLTFVLGGINCSSNKSLVKNEKPRIKSIKSSSHSADLENNNSNNGKAYTLKEYDIKGNLIKSEQYDMNGNLKWRYLNEYDDYGNQINSSSYSSSSRINTVTKSEYVYDSNGNILKKFHQSGNEYRPNKNVSESEYFYKNGNLIREVRKEVYLGKEETISKKYKYNEFNSIDSIYIFRDEHLSETTAFNYNDNGLLLETLKVTYPKGGNPKYIKVTKKFDGANNTILEIAEDPTGYYYKKEFEFNSLGLETKFKEYKKNGEIITDDSFEYTLDEYQNWIKSKRYSFGKSDWISKREIEYHK